MPNEPHSQIKIERAFVVISCMFLTATAVMSIDKMVSTSVKESDFTFALFILVNSGFCSFYVIHGFLYQRPYELGILLVSVFSMALYTVLNFSTVDKRESVKIGRLALVCVMSIPIMLFCVKIGLVYNNSEDFIKRNVNAGSILQGMCKTLFLFHDLLKIDLQLGISMVILILNSTDDVAYDDYIVLSVGLIISIGWFILGYYSSCKENKDVMMVFFIGSLAEPGYVLYKMIKSEEQTKTNLKSASLTCGYLALVFRVVLVVTSILVRRNFDEGLKEIINSTSPNNYSPMPDTQGDTDSSNTNVNRGLPSPGDNDSSLNTNENHSLSRAPAASNYSSTNTNDSPSQPFTSDITKPKSLTK